MQEELRQIIKRFKQNDYQSSANKQNNYRHQSSSKDQTLSKEHIQSLNNKIKSLQKTIQALITDGNKMHRYYQQLIHQDLLQFDAYKEQYSNFRNLAAEQKKQAMITFLNEKIQTLNAQVTQKEQQYRQLFDKFENLQDRTSLAQLQQSEHVKDIEKQMVKVSMHHQSERITTSMEIQQMKKKLSQLLDNNQQLLNQNCYLKHMNESLGENIEYLKNRLYAEQDVIHEQITQQAKLSLIELERCEVDSISKEQDRMTLEEIKMSDSRELILNGQKEVLNISEHYSKFNRTQQFLSKQKSNYEFVITDSNERQSFAKKKETAVQNNKFLVKIDTIKSKEQQRKNPSSRIITQVKQFKMQQSNESNFIDPYKAFFVLLTQCEKMNSRYFDRISHIDLTYLYPELIAKFIPYNLWQQQIKKTLEGKIKKSDKASQ